MWSEDAPVEIVDASAGVEDTWTTQVWENSRKMCSNCGGEDRIRAVMIVPEEAGGKRIASNGCLLCRTCDVARSALERRGEPASGDEARPINFWVSRKLHATLQNGLSHKYGFKSVASLVRFLMGKYVGDASRFDDVLQFQDHGADVKVNVWVPRDTYAKFKDIADANGGTVTDTIKGLIRMYELEAERVIGKGRGQ